MSSNEESGKTLEAASQEISRPVCSEQEMREKTGELEKLLRDAEKEITRRIKAEADFRERARMAEDEAQGARAARAKVQEAAEAKVRHAEKLAEDAVKEAEWRQDVLVRVWKSLNRYSAYESEPDFPAMIRQAFGDIPQHVETLRKRISEAETGEANARAGLEASNKKLHLARAQLRGCERQRDELTKTVNDLRGQLGDIAQADVEGWDRPGMIESLRRVEGERDVALEQLEDLKAQRDGVAARLKVVEKLRDDAVKTAQVYQEEARRLRNPSTVRVEMEERPHSMKHDPDRIVRAFMQGPSRERAEPDVVEFLRKKVGDMDRRLGAIEKKEESRGRFLSSLQGSGVAEVFRDATKAIEEANKRLEEISSRKKLLLRSGWREGLDGGGWVSPNGDRFSFEDAVEAQRFVNFREKRRALVSTGWEESHGGWVDPEDGELYPFEDAIRIQDEREANDDE